MPLCQLWRNLIYESFEIRHVPQPIHKNLCSINPNTWVYGIELLSSSDRSDHVTTTSDIESMAHTGVTGECWVIGEVLDHDQYLKAYDCLLGSS